MMVTKNLDDFRKKMDFGPKNCIFGPKFCIFLRYTYETPIFLGQTHRTGLITCPPYPEVTLDTFGFPVDGRLAARRAVSFFFFFIGQMGLGTHTLSSTQKSFNFTVETRLQINITFQVLLGGLKKIDT